MTEQCVTNLANTVLRIDIDRRGHTHTHVHTQVGWGDRGWVGAVDPCLRAEWVARLGANTVPFSIFHVLQILLMSNPEATGYWHQARNQPTWMFIRMICLLPFFQDLQQQKGHSDSQL